MYIYCCNYVRVWPSWIILGFLFNSEFQHCHHMYILSPRTSA